MSSTTVRRISNANANVAVNANANANANVAVAVTADGRHARRDRNRLAVVDAMLTLYAEGNLDPSSDEIAERAGLSPRSLFRYFDDLDDLVRVAISRQHERVMPMAQLDVSTDASLSVRIDRLVAQRLRLFDAISSVGVVSRVRAPFHPLIADELAISRSMLRRQVERLFAPELGARGPGAASAIAAIDVLTSFESIQLLCGDQHLDRASVDATLTDSLARLLAP